MTDGPLTVISSSGPLIACHGDGYVQRQQFRQACRPLLKTLWYCQIRAVSAQWRQWIYYTRPTRWEQPIQGQWIPV